MLTGYVKKWDYSNGWGFIESDDDGYDYFISGHYHQAKELQMKKGKLIILGDWLSFFTYAKFDGKDLKLHYWNNNEKS